MKREVWKKGVEVHVRERGGTEGEGRVDWWECG